MLWFPCKDNQYSTIAFCEGLTSIWGTFLTSHRVKKLMGQIRVMLVYAEIRPIQRMDLLEEHVSELGKFHGFNVPDAPLGRPSPLPLSIACIVRRMYPSKPLIINQRLLDVNELYIRGLILSAKQLGLDIAFTRGDEPRIGRSVGYLSSEEAVRLAQSEGVRAGMMLSMAYPRTAMESRIRSGADFFLVLNLADPSQLRGLDTSRLIPYLLIGTDRNREWIKRLGQPYIDIQDLPRAAGELEKMGVNAILLSSPRDPDALLSAIEVLKL